MKTAIFFLLVGLGILAFLYYSFDIRFTGTLDIHYKDTYLIIDYSHVIWVVSLFLATMFSVGGLLGSGFRSKIFLLLFIACLCGIGYVIWQVYITLYS